MQRGVVFWASVLEPWHDKRSFLLYLPSSSTSLKCSKKCCSCNNRIDINGIFSLVEKSDRYAMNLATKSDLPLKHAKRNVIPFASHCSGCSKIWDRRRKSKMGDVSGA